MKLISIPGSQILINPASVIAVRPQNRPLTTNMRAEVVLVGEAGGIGLAVESTLPVDHLAALIEEATRPKEEGTETIPRFALRHGVGGNPDGYTCDAGRSGDRGIYDEARAGIYSPDGACVGDVLVGLDEHGEPRVLVTADGNGDGDHAYAIFPLRPKDSAIQKFE